MICSTGKNTRSPVSMAGVTLIELMIVIVVLSILSSIAVSSYRRYMLRANRTEATTTLLRIQVAQEKYFLNNNAYATTMTQVKAAPPAGLGIGLTASDKTQNGYYTLSFEGTPTTTAYVIKAVATGTQTQDDSACTTLSIDQSGARNPPESSGCWR